MSSCPPRLRSVNGKHTPFVRPGCGFESCRRLSRDTGRLPGDCPAGDCPQPAAATTSASGQPQPAAGTTPDWSQPHRGQTSRSDHAPVAQRTEPRPATAGVAGSNPAGRIALHSRGRSSAGRAPERHSGETRSIRVVRFTSPWCNGSTPSSNLDGPGSNPGGLAGRGSRCVSSWAEAVRLSGQGGDPAERASNPARTETARAVPVCTP